jgi:hypothetical protein
MISTAGSGSDMSYAAMKAVDVYQACHGALAMRREQKMDVGGDFENFARLGRLSDLAHHIEAIKGNAAEVFVSAEDFALITGFWPQTSSITAG